MYFLWSSRLVEYNVFGGRLLRLEMNARADFDREMKMLLDKAGPEAASRAYLVLSDVIRWLHRHGHGDIKLSAINHMLASKFRVDTVVDAERK